VSIFLTTALIAVAIAAQGNFVIAAVLVIVAAIYNPRGNPDL
jgi:hypothetical protein